jgi:DNA-binding FadR family transcriptional regulator
MSAMRWSGDRRVRAGVGFFFIGAIVAVQRARCVMTEGRLPVGMFKTVRTQRGFEAVCEQIRDHVARGLLRPGQRLPAERELALQFNVGRTGVREALRSLEHAGLLEARTGSNGGFFIRDGGTRGVVQSVRDMVALGQVPVGSITEARIELTCLAIRLACERAGDEELAAIEKDIEHHADLFRRGRGSRNPRSLGEFYRLLARATHNDVIVMLVDALSEVVRALLMRADPQPQEDMIRVRRTVLQYLRAGDADRACAAMTRHLQQLNELLEAQRA